MNPQRKRPKRAVEKRAADTHHTALRRAQRKVEKIKRKK